MNKKLFLLPFLSLSLLIGCGKKGDNPPKKEIWELEEVEGESTIAEVKAGTAGEYYTVRGTVVANSGSTLAIYRKGQFLYCYNFNADTANNGGQENLKAHPLGSYVEIHAQSSSYSNSVQLTAYDVGTDKTDKKYDRAASLEVLATKGETVAPVEVTTAEGLANAEAAGKLMKLSFVASADKELTNSGSANQDVPGKVGSTIVNLRLEKFCDENVRAALLENNPATFEDHATYEVVALGAATSDGTVRGILCEGSSWRKTADAHFDDPTNVIVEAPDDVTTLEAGKTLQLDFSVLPSGAKQEVTWTSSAPEVASVEDGLVTGLAANATPVTITAATVANPAITGTYQLTIVAPAAQPLTETVTLNFSGLTQKGTYLDSIKDGNNQPVPVVDTIKSCAGAGASHITGATATTVRSGNGSGGAYPNTAGFILFSTGSANGSLVLELDGLVNKVVINGHDWYKASADHPTNSNSLAVNGSEAQLAPYNEAGTPGDMTFNLAAASDTITIAATGRVFVFTITLSYVAA